eukprot:SAG31_NODE_399_length_16247_cov_19.137540_16_plen_142_part_00
MGMDAWMHGTACLRLWAGPWRRGGAVRTQLQAAHRRRQGRPSVRWVPAAGERRGARAYRTPRSGWLDAGLALAALGMPMRCTLLVGLCVAPCCTSSGIGIGAHAPPAPSAQPIVQLPPFTIAPGVEMPAVNVGHPVSARCT